MSWRIGAALLLLACTGATAGAQGGTGSVRGTIFDSLARRPLEGAVVFVSGTSRIATTDQNGRFDIDSVPAGRRAVTYSSPALDSLGLFALGKDIDVAPGGRVDLALGTPSFTTVWRTLCPTARASRDSGIVYGTVADAANDTRLAGARVVFSWWDIAKQGNNVSIERPVLVARSDSVGNYYACGLPADMNVTVEVDAAPLSSGNMETMLPASRVARRDLLASAEMYVADSIRRRSGDVLDDGLGVRRRGSATLRGEVRDAKGAPVPDAAITLPSADTTVRTDADGRFVVGGLPGGTQLVRARKLGNGPLTETVALQPAKETSVLLSLPPANVLAAVNVRADRANRTLAQFDERKLRGGFGYFVGEAELRNKVDMQSALSGLPALRVTNSRGVVTLLIERGMRTCAPLLFLNGTRSIPEEITMYRPEELYGIEIYTNPSTVPAQYLGTSTAPCGAVLVWTKDAR